MKIKTRDLTGGALDWAVAKCEGVAVEINTAEIILARRLRSLTHEEAALLAPPVPYCTIMGVGQAKYSTNWTQGGPIIERENMSVMPVFVASRTESGQEITRQDGWQSFKSKAFYWMTPNPSFGETPLIAAMRCYVANKLGEEIEMPDGIA